MTVALPILKQSVCLVPRRSLEYSNMMLNVGKQRRIAPWSEGIDCLCRCSRLDVRVMFVGSWRAWLAGT
jgi:hypothetical protein